jgi:hypothetical protein
LAAAIPPAAARSAVGACDSSGMYTDRLCAEDHMNPGTYIHSPNDQFRMYFHVDGSARVYDVSDWENWVEKCTVKSSHNNPGYLIYGIPNPPSPLGPLSLLAYDSSNGFVGQAFGFFPPGDDPDGLPDAPHFMALENDGRIGVYDQDGARWIAYTCL